jgi:hypothetical protein
MPRYGLVTNLYCWHPSSRATQVCDLGVSRTCTVGSYKGRPSLLAKGGRLGFRMFRNETSLRDSRLSGSIFLAIKSEKEDEGFCLQLGQECVHVRGPAPQDEPEVPLDVLLMQRFLVVFKARSATFTSRGSCSPSKRGMGTLKVRVTRPKI